MSTTAKTTKKPKLAQRVLAWVKQNGGKKRAIPLLALLAVGDFFVPVLPTQTSVIMLSLLQPNRRWFTVIAFALAAALGTVMLAILVTVFNALTDIDSQQWLALQRLVNDYGLWVLFALSMLPTPPRSMVVVCLLSGIAAPLVVLTVLAGKLVWYSAAVNFICVAKHWLMRFNWFARIRLKV